VAAARSLEAPGAVQPVLWRVLRDGHVNVNAPERLAALDAVAQWAVTGVSPGDRDDATIEVDAGSSSAVIVAPDGSLRATVRDLARVYGNLFTDLRPADLERLGVAQGESFTLTAPGGTFTVFYGTTYTDVPQGGWIAFPTAEGTVMIARNRGNAAEAANLATGDTFAVAKAR
jgi:S-adenosylmethionine hydrolase